jgi:hypothetical protein
MDSNISAWTSGAGVFTFAALYILFLVGAAALWMMYIKPVVTPGHGANARARAVVDTPLPGQPSSRPAAPSTAEGAAASQDKAGE